MAENDAPFHPIIYVRGFAMSRAEIDETTADPFCGFNLGSTVFRAVPERARPPRKFVFESPVIRLASDFDYRDVYEDGYDLVDPEWKENPENKLGNRSIIVYRYYDEASSLLGTSETPPIETFATKLGKLILEVRALVCANEDNGIAPDDFRCYLVAHSMGGLVCRAFLQNAKLDPDHAARFVDKLFTYATPHNGIDVGGLNVPGWLTAGDISNFNRDRMAKYLAIEKAYAETKAVSWLPESRFPSSRVFCMVGTNRLDYEAGMGLSRTFVGHGSDGLVRIENATLKGLRDDGKPGDACAKAFTYRSHSGVFGIVNSEESYQNLTRFLFGDVRVDIHLDIDEIRVPKELAEDDAAGKVNALYQIELLASPRGKMWYLTRRTAEEDSVACMSHADWKHDPKANGTHYLSTVFLANRARVNKRRKSLAYAMTLGVRAPDYEVSRTLWFDKHYEGGYLFRDALVFEIVPPAKDGTWGVKYAWQGQSVRPATKKVDPKELAGGKVEIEVAFDSKTAPGVTGKVRLVLSAWNGEGDGDE
ncbi:MAG TPA: hypothetical protein VFZ65_04260 [Planctomycetota bacterium]|nr:hypothetical protein [Planctomycetota bacterium]